MRSPTKQLRRRFMENELLATSYRQSGVKDTEKEQNVVEWITFFRRNIDIFIEEWLCIKLRPFQRVALHLAGVSETYMLVCSRGLGKSWLASVYALAVSCLYPYSEIVITSSTVAQANRLAEKMFSEVIKKNSKVLLHMYEREYLVKTQRDDGWQFENKLNGSIIRVLPALDSSRGQRATMLIYEEARLIKAGMIQSVFRPMAHPRQAKYLSIPAYSDNPRWLEESHSIYLSSASYKHEWLFRQWKKCVTDMLMSNKSVTNVFAGDIYTSIENGFKTVGDYYRAQKMSSDTAFQMEDLNVWIGEAEDAFFNYEQFKTAQVLKDCFRPLTPTEVALDEEVNFPPKGENEIRIVAADFAFTETKGNGNESDFTQFVCVSGHWKKDRFERHVDYMETWPANDDDGAVQRLKEIYFDYDASYIVADARNGGENVIIQFSKPTQNENRGSRWTARGFGMADTMAYHIANKEKVDFYRSRAIDKDCIPCIIPFIGSATTNTAYWRSMKRTLDRGMFKMLVSMQEKQENLENNGQYYQLTSEQLAEELAPYGQGDMLIKEAVELTSEIRNDQIKLVEPRSGHKDRIVTLSMAMLVIDKIEEEWNRQAQDDDEDYENIQLVF